MKKYLWILPIIILIVISIWLALKPKEIIRETPDLESENKTLVVPVDNEEVTLSNPASELCVIQGGESQILSASDGSQFGMCAFEEYSCEEWALYRGECNIEEDALIIKQKLIEKGLDLTGMEVRMIKHMGEYIEASVVPVDMLGGGGYVFAVKDEGDIKILADGNGAIMCSAFETYPEFPSYLVANCIDETGMEISR